MNILKYFLILLIINSGFSLYAHPAGENQNQQTEPPEAENDTIDEPEEPSFEVQPFLRLGLDISAIGRQIIERDVQQLEFSADSEIIHNWFAVLEGGYMRVNANREDFTYLSSGFFGRLGFDFNLLGRNSAEQNDLVVIGLRYAYSRLSHEAPFFVVTNPYWGGHDGMVESSNYNLHWIEFSGGLRTEVYRNIFLGWTLKTRVRVSPTSTPDLEPFYIAGFGQGNRRAPVMVHATVYYKFPF